VERSKRYKTSSLLTSVEKTDEHKSPTKITFNIGSSGEQVQVGESNHMLVISVLLNWLRRLLNLEIHKAKSVLKQLLENSTVASIVGAGASALLNLL
jgi:hypothetical protein